MYVDDLHTAATPTSIAYFRERLGRICELPRAAKQKTNCQSKPQGPRFLGACTDGQVQICTNSSNVAPYTIPVCISPANSLHLPNVSAIICRHHQLCKLQTSSRLSRGQNDSYCWCWSANATTSYAAKSCTHVLPPCGIDNKHSQ
jgi:hypothetical protein